jgi:catechol 2,3-dioxygenase-like lactoylglutathione lyase family enzyme
MATVSVRYIVDSVDGAIAFYTQHLGFSLDAHPAPGFAILSRDDLRLLLNAPSGPGGEMVSRVEAKFVKQGVRERGPITRCAEEDAAPVLGDSSPPQTAQRLLMVGKGGGGDSMTSIDRNGIRNSQTYIPPVINL